MLGTVTHPYPHHYYTSCHNQEGWSEWGGRTVGKANDVIKEESEQNHDMLQEGRGICLPMIIVSVTKKKKKKSQGQNT